MEAKARAMNGIEKGESPSPTRISPAQNAVRIPLTINP
jgi:hypothetical protein